MKKLLCLLTLVAGAMAAITSCKKDEVRTVLNIKSVSPPTLAASSSSIVLDSTKNTATAVTFNWGAVNYGYNSVATYTLQFDVPTDTFKHAVNVVVGANVTSKSYTVKDLNALAYQTLSLPANVSSPISVRLKVDLNQATGSASNVSSLYSNVIAINVTPYQILIVFPLVYVPGDYQGWNPGAAPAIASMKSNQVYEGYVNIPTGGTYQFKITSAPDWSHTNYGDGGGDVVMPGAAGPSNSGKLSSSGGNLTVPTGGYYRINADLNALTWSAEATTWAIIGDAPIASNSWANDVPMTFNSSTNTWTVTTDFKAGSFKFRANGDWNNYLHNFGDNSPADGIPDYGGSNIAIAAAGNYTITLNLSTPGNYTYTIKKN